MKKYILFLFLFFSQNIYSQILTQRTVKREFDPIIIQGFHLKLFLGKKIANMRVYAFSNNNFYPVPYQIDEKDKDGDYIFDWGRKTNYENKGIFDENDELVFMARDLGDKTDPALYIKGFEIFSEINVCDPQTLERGWIYVLYFASSVPDESPIDYVNYLPEEEKVIAKTYTVKFQKDIPTIISELATTKEGGGKDKNIIDRLKIRFLGKTFFGLVVKVNEDNFVSETIAARDGKVRVIRRTKSKVIFYKIIPSPSAISDNIFYFSHFEFPFIVNLEFDVSNIFTKASLRVTTECNTPSRKFYNTHNLEGVNIDGMMSDNEINLNFSPYTWSCIAKEEEDDKSAWLNRIIIQTNAPVQPQLYYMDDINVPDPPETFPGQLGNVGYTLDNFQWLKKGVHKFTSILYSLPKYEIGDEKIYLDMLDNPLKFWVNHNSANN